MEELIKTMAQLNEMELQKTLKYMQMLLFFRKHGEPLNELLKSDYDAYSVNQEIGNQLKQLREQLSLSVNRIAELTFINRKTWIKYERGLSSPTVSEYKRIYQLLQNQLMIA